MGDIECFHKSFRYERQPRRNGERGGTAHSVCFIMFKILITIAVGFSAAFAIDDFQRHCLMEGLDDIGLTLLHESDIAAYELLH